MSASGTGTFMPKKLDTTVGIAMMIVMAAKNFMTRFWLFEIMDENVSAMRARILLYISTISRACLFSMMTSSKRSSSSS